MLIRAAYEMFLIKGYHATVVSDITARAGLAVGTYYKAFANKREILDHVIDYGLQNALDAILDDEVTMPASTFVAFEQQLRTISIRIDTVFTESPQLAKFLMLEATTVDDEITRRWQGIIDLGISLMAGYLERGVEAGFLRSDLDVQSTANAVYGMSFMFVLQNVYESDDPRRSDRYIDAVMSLLVGGIKAEPRD